MKRKLPMPFVPMPSPSWEPDPSCPLTLAERVTLGVFLAEWRGGADIVEMGKARLAHRACVSTSHAQRALRSLIARGLLVEVRKGAAGRGNLSRYSLSEKVLGGPIHPAEKVQETPIKGPGWDAVRREAEPERPELDAPAQSVTEIGF